MRLAIAMPLACGLSLLAAACVPFVQRGPATLTPLSADSAVARGDTLHVRFRVVNRSHDEFRVQMYAGGPSLDIRDSAGRMRCLPQDTTGGVQYDAARPIHRVVIPSAVVVSIRVMPGKSTILRHDLPLRPLQDCGPGRFTVSTSVVIVLPNTRGRQWTLTSRPMAFVITP